MLYWYRSAPGVRVGRAALDEDAIRTIEEQHPEVEFDWPQILEVGAATQPEVERKPVRPLRRPKPPRPRDEAALAPAFVPESQAEAAEDVLEEPEPAAVVGEESEEETEEAVAVPRGHDLLEELVGHEIATRLRARYSEIINRIHRLPGGHAQRDAWEARADALNPDNWVTPAEVLAGVQRADALFDALRRELLAL